MLVAATSLQTGLSLKYMAAWFDYHLNGTPAAHNALVAGSADVPGLLTRYVFEEATSSGSDAGGQPSDGGPAETDLGPVQPDASPGGAGGGGCAYSGRGGGPCLGSAVVFLLFALSMFRRRTVS